MRDPADAWRLQLSRGCILVIGWMKEEYHGAMAQRVG
jgi:hypothetical protein